MIFELGLSTLLLSTMVTLSDSHDTAGTAVAVSRLGSALAIKRSHDNLLDAGSFVVGLRDETRRVVRCVVVVGRLSAFCTHMHSLFAVSYAETVERGLRHISVD